MVAFEHDQTLPLQVLQNESPEYPSCARAIRNPETAGFGESVRGLEELLY